MTPVKQKFGHSPENGVWGDCHRAAIASVLDLPIDDVPHIGDGGCDRDEFVRREREFLRSRGLVPCTVPIQADSLDAMLRMMKLVNPGVYYLIGGQSRTGCGHTVVALDDAIVHDPSGTDAGIVGPMEDDGLYWVTFFGSGLAAVA